MVSLTNSLTARQLKSGGITGGNRAYALQKRFSTQWVVSQISAATIGCEMPKNRAKNPVFLPKKLQFFRGFKLLLQPISEKKTGGPEWRPPVFPCTTD
jgi:hypothetical protein